MPYGTFSELTSDSTLGAPAGASKITYDRGFTYQSSGECKSLITRTGVNNVLNKPRVAKPSKIRQIIGWRLVIYRDKKAKKVKETRTFLRKIKKVTYRTVTYRDKSKKPTLKKIYRHGVLIRQYLVYPKVTKKVPHTEWISVYITKDRWVYPRVERYKPVYAPKKKVPRTNVMRTPSLVPTNLTTYAFKMGKRYSSGSTAGYQRTNPGVPWVIKGDFWGPLWNYTRLRSIATPLIIVPNEQIYVAGYQATIDKLDQQVLGRLYDGIANCGPNLLVALGTYGQTASFIAEAAQKVAQIIKAYKSGNFQKLGTILGHEFSPTGLADNWLKLQYALKPLLSDINASVEQFSKSEDLTFDVIRTATQSGESISSALYKNDAPTFLDTRKVVSKVTVRYKARLRVNNAGIRALAQLGMTNPAVLAWEVIPFSFVADWLIPIGNTLGRLSALDGISVESWHRTVFIREDITFARKFGGNDYNNEYIWGSGFAGAQATRIYCNRLVKSTNLPKPPLPKIKNPFSSTHILNAAALLTSLRR